MGVILSVSYQIYGKYIRAEFYIKFNYELSICAWRDYLQVVPVPEAMETQREVQVFGHFESCHQSIHFSNPLFI